MVKDFLGRMVELREKHAKSHTFEGGWNGYEFYTDKKGTPYAVKKAPSTFTISWERMMSE
jgi:hypothetical protein